MIVAIHGWSFDSSVWKRAELRVELPGHGASPFSSTTVVGLAQELSSFLPKTPVHLVGWSLGATVAAVFAALYPERVERLSLVAPTPKFCGLSQPLPVVRRFLKRLKRDFRGSTLYFRSLCSKAELPLPKVEPEKGRAILEDFALNDFSPYFEKVRADTEIFVGEEDSITGLEGAFKAFSLIKGAALSVFPEADHLTVLERLSF
jgi:pimeloyl-[acyl-carrier protein] methyl ester esterase